jgi:hypothetical protein
MPCVGWAVSSALGVHPPASSSALRPGDWLISRAISTPQNTTTVIIPMRAVSTMKTDEIHVPKSSRPHIVSSLSLTKPPCLPLLLASLYKFSCLTMSLSLACLRASFKHISHESLALLLLSSWLPLHTIVVRDSSLFSFHSSFHSLQNIKSSVSSCNDCIDLMYLYNMKC